MDFVNEKHSIGAVFKGFEHALEALLKIAPVFGACQQCAHIQGIHHRISQHFGYVFLGNPPGQSLGNRSFSHASFTHQQGIVFSAAAQNLNHALDFVLAPDQGVDLAFFGQLVQILGVLLKRRRFFVFLARGFFGLRPSLAAFCGFRRIALFDAMGDEIDHVQAGDTLLVQVIDRVRIFFAKDGYQHIATHHLFFTAAGGLHMHDGALDDPLKAQGRLGIDLIYPGYLGRVVLNEMGERLAQFIDVGRAGAQDFGGAGVIQQSEQ